MPELVVSAPGKVILHGEHAVVYGKKALAASLDLRTFLRLVPCCDERNVTVALPDLGINITWSTETLEQSLSLPLCDTAKPQAVSEELLNTLKELAQLPDDTSDTKSLAVVAFLYLYCCIAPREQKLPGVRIHLASCLPLSAGLGSSAAFSACLAASMLLWRGHISSPSTKDNSGATSWPGNDLDLINQWAFQAEKIIHGNPSGIDNSISTYGGALVFQNGKLTTLDKVPKVSVLLMNTHVPRSTKVLVAGVRQRYEKYPDIMGPVLESVEAITEKCQSILALMHEDPSHLHYKELQELISMNQGQLYTMGVSQSDLDTICGLCSRHGLAAKLTGAGGGGCAFALIPPDAADTVKAVSDEVTRLGYSCWQTSVGGHGVLHHLTLDNKNFALPETFQTTLGT